MHEHGLAKELWPQLRGIAETKNLRRVDRIEMIVGLLHGATAEVLVHSFEHAFAGTTFQGASVRVTIVEPGEEFTPPNSDRPALASGWEILVVRIEGQE
jgi:Zn finger protein HypA/HybF involved in hydrogenase expression